MASINYNEGIQSLLDRDIDWVGDTIKAMLVTSSYTPNKDDDMLNVADSARVSGTTDQTINNRSVLINTTSDFVFLKGDNVTFTAVAGGATIAGVVVYKSTGTANSSKLIAYHDVTNTATNGSNVTIAWPSDANGGITKFQL